MLVSPQKKPHQLLQYFRSIVLDYGIAIREKEIMRWIYGLMDDDL